MISTPPAWMPLLALRSPLVNAYLKRGEREGFGVLLLSALAHDLAVESLRLTQLAVDAEARAMPRPLEAPDCDGPDWKDR